jgi:hypothetical protein
MLNAPEPTFKIEWYVLVDEPTIKSPVMLNALLFEVLSAVTTPVPEQDTLKYPPTVNVPNPTTADAVEVVLLVTTKFP